MTPRLLWVAVLVLAAHLTPTETAVRVWGLRASDLTGDFWSHPDPYVMVWCGSSFGGMTEIISNTPHPSWNAEFYFRNCNANDILKLEVWDSDLNFDDKLVTCITHVQHSYIFTMSCNVSPGKLTFTYEMI